MGSTQYSIFADLNGSGAISVSDIGPMRANLGELLPASQQLFAVADQAELVLDPNDQPMAANENVDAVMGEIGDALESSDWAKFDTRVVQAALQSREMDDLQNEPRSRTIKGDAFVP